MTGEMSKADVTREAFPTYFAIADALGGTVHPFDVYQGPYIREPGGRRLWLYMEGDGPLATVYDDTRDEKSAPFHCEDTDAAVQAALDLANPVVPVLFRADRAGTQKGTVTAVFPTLPGTAGRDDMQAYAHVGQHSACSYGWYRTTRPATPAEYADLQRELESAPYRYRLKVCRRITRQMDAARRKAAR